MNKHSYLQQGSLIFAAMHIIGESVNKEVFTVASREYAVYQLLSPSILMMPIEQRFGSLALTWKKEKAYYSSVTEMISNNFYLQIIAMGPSAIPLILTDLKNQPEHWFVALRALTGVNPVVKAERGNIVAMSESWLKWGKQNGYKF